MPLNGEANRKLGLYKSVCCGTEIVIRAGSTFPDCPNHPNLITIWEPIVDEEISQLTAKESRSDPGTVLHIENRRLFNFAFGRLELEEREQQHLHRCKVCQGVLNVFADLSPTDNPPKASGAA